MRFALCALIVVALALAGCADSGSQKEGPSADPTPSRDPGTAGTASNASVVDKPNATTWSAKGHLTADLFHLGVDPTGEGAIVRAAIPSNVTTLVAELQWTGDASDFYLILESPRFCPEGNGPTGRLESGVCKVSDDYAENSLEAFHASRPKGTLGQGKLRIELDAATMGKHRCPQDPCNWVGVAAWKTAVTSNFEVRITAFLENASTPGLSGLQDQGPSTTSLRDSGDASSARGAALLAVTSMGLGLMAWRRPRLGSAFLAFFSRLERSTVLDQEIRGRIHELIQVEPGIHPADISERLELSKSHARHHLRVLVRQQIVVRLRDFGRDAYFLRGRFAPEHMRRLAALRHDSYRRIHDVVVANAGVTVGELAVRIGLSVARVSKIVRRLCDAGLLRRDQIGRKASIQAIA